MPPAMAIALLLFGLVFVTVFMSDFRAALRSRRYRKVEGILRKAWIEQHGEWNSNREIFTPRVVYAFTAGGRTHVGTRFTVPARSLRSRKEAEEQLSAYTAGMPLDVWYDPDAPEYCCLRKTHPVEASLPVVFGGLLMAGGAVALALLLS